MIIYGNRYQSRYDDIRSELLELMREIDLPTVYRAIAGDFLFHWWVLRSTSSLPIVCELPPLPGDELE